MLAACQPSDITEKQTHKGRAIHEARELAWHFKWKVDERWSFQTDLQWVHATNSGEFGMINLGTFVPSMGVDVSGARPAFNFDEKSRKFLADPKNYYWDISQPDRNKAEADLYAWKPDGKFDFGRPVLRDLRFGVRVTERSSTKHKNSGTGWKSYAEEWAVQPTKVAGQLPKAADLGWQRGNLGYMSDSRYAGLGEVEQFAFPNFFNGRMSAPPTIVLKANFSGNLQSRVALSRGIYRPGFDQLQEYITLDQKVTMDTAGISGPSRTRPAASRTSRSPDRQMRPSSGWPVLNWPARPTWINSLVWLSACLTGRRAWACP